MTEAPLIDPDDKIRRILRDTRTIAMVGASANVSRPSYMVLTFLLQKGFRVFPVNPGQAGRPIFGTIFYPDLNSIPEPVDMIDVFRASEAVQGVVAEALRLLPLPKVIWTQLGVRDDAAAATAEAAGIEVVMDRCPKIEYARLCG